MVESTHISKSAPDARGLASVTLFDGMFAESHEKFENGEGLYICHEINEVAYVSARKPNGDQSRSTN